MTNPLDIFIQKFVFTNAYREDDFINYSFEHFTRYDTYPIRIANTIIQENELPLKAEIIGLPTMYVLHITEK